ncbi:MAG: ATP-binding protein [Chloroflexota bacterium]|nr:ATP-binding protein [Chloroflexota bacterium]
MVHNQHRRFDVEDLGAILRNLTSKKLRKSQPENGSETPQQPERTALPDDAVCPVCRHLRADHPAVIERLATIGARTCPNPCVCGTSPAPGPVDRLLRYANLPHPDNPRTFANWIPRKGAEEGYTAAREYATGMAMYHVLMLIGDTGTGKSHLVEAIAREWLARGRIVKYELVAKLLEHLRATYEDGSRLGFLDVFERYGSAHLLVLDDLGEERVTPWVAEKLTMLIDERYRTGRHMAIATNLVEDDVRQMYHGRLASRLWDTHTGAVKVVALQAADFRLEGP